MSKYSIKSSNGTPEVSSARSRLDGVLQTLVERKDASESPDQSLKEEVELSDSVPNTPTKRPGAGKPPRKRRKGARTETPAVEIGQYHHTYVMKLYDRSVDLAQFEEETPLYPICRAWMQNQPHSRVVDTLDQPSSPEQHNTDSEEEMAAPLSVEAGDIYQLPVPIPVKLEQGKDLRIPSPIPMQDDEPLDIDNIGGSSVLPEVLLINHLNHWKKVRQSWKDAARRNEARYVESWQTLRQMFDQQCKDM